MAKKTWNLRHHDFEEQRAFSGSEVGGKAEPLMVKLQRHRNGLSNGVDEIEIANGSFRVSVLPTRGMSVWKAWSGDNEIGWRSPVRGPVHPAFVDVGEPSGLGWLDGFDELLVRCGLESNGAPEFNEDGSLKYPLHGRAGNKPARDVKVTIDSESGEVEVEGVVDEIRFHFLKVSMISKLRVAVGEKGFRVHDQVVNHSASPAEVQILYHVNFGHPLLDGGSQVVAPLDVLVPRNDHAASGIDRWSHYQAETPGFEEQVYFATLRGGKNDQTEVLLKNAHATRGVSLQYKTTQLPCFTVWKNTTAVSDGYVTGIEPGTNYPNPRTFEGEHGRVAKLAGNGTTEFGLQMVVHDDADAVTGAEKRIGQLAGDKAPTIHKTPQDTWCAP